MPHRQDVVAVQYYSGVYKIGHVRAPCNIRPVRIQQRSRLRPRLRVGGAWARCMGAPCAAPVPSVEPLRAWMHRSLSLSVEPCTRAKVQTPPVGPCAGVTAGYPGHDAGWTS